MKDDSTPDDSNSKEDKPKEKAKAPTKAKAKAKADNEEDEDDMFGDAFDDDIADESQAGDAGDAGDADNADADINEIVDESARGDNDVKKGGDDELDFADGDFDWMTAAAVAMSAGVDLRISPQRTKQRKTTLMEKTSGLMSH